MSKLVSANASSEFLRLIQHNLYNKRTHTIDLAMGKEVTQRVVDMMPVPKEDLDYVRESDGFSILHLANSSHNPYLVALFLHFEVGLFYNSSKCVGPIEFIKRTQHLVEGMSEALFDPESFLRREWGIKFNYAEENKDSDEESKEDEFVPLEQIAVPPVANFIIHEEPNLDGDILMGDCFES